MKKNYLLIEKELNKNNIKYLNKIIGKPYFIEMKGNGKYNLFKYNENLGCDFNKRIVCECRSVILKDNAEQNRQDKAEINIKYKRVAIPFYKFFNYTEHQAKKIAKDFKNKKLYGYEKIDGSIIIMWYDDNEWHFSTSGNIDACVTPLHNQSVFKTYGELFKYCLNRTQIDINKLNKNYTYMFELISPYNRVVVKYDEPEIYHIGTRNNITLKENFDYIGVQQPRYIEFNGLNEAIDYVKNINRNNKNYEGIVVRDDNFNRLKIKTSIWFQLHSLNNNGVLTNQRILNMIEQGDDNEFLSYFPEFNDEFYNIKDRISTLYDKIEKEIFNADYTKTKKEYYYMVKDLPYANILIKCFSIGISNLNKNEIKEFIDKQINSLPKKKYLNILEKIK